MRSRPELLALLMLLACGGEEDAATGPDAGPWASLEERPCPDKDLATWDNFAHGFFRTWCTSCHSSDLVEGMRQDAPPEINLDTRAGVAAHAERIWAAAADDNGLMPPIGGPSAEERRRLGEWLACGMP